MTRKHDHHAAIRARAALAISSLYHNATPSYPREMYGRSNDYFQSWFEDTARFEIEYLQDGGSTPGDYRATLAAPCNAGKYKSRRARQYYVDTSIRARDLERADCAALTGWYVLEMAAGNTRLRREMGYKFLAENNTNLRRYKRSNAQWERITEYGKLYQYGRGGRTLAPDRLIQGRGSSSFRVRGDSPVGSSIADCMDLIIILESFNAHVTAWCASVPEQWREHCEELDCEAREVKRQAATRKACETRERKYWAARGMVTV